jgi:acyl dehydratase
MPLNPDSVGYTTKPYEASWDSKDCLLYALGVGAGATDPTGSELEFTTENTEGVNQQVLPTFPVVIARGSEALASIGDYNMAMLVHGEQSIEVHAPIPVAGSVASTTTVTGIYDKGSGAVVTTSTTAADTVTGAELWTLTNAMFIKGEGGWGGDRGPSTKVTFPERDPDHRVTYGTRPDQALLYRLSGDRNPLHADPSYAVRGGFARPILHGLCTFGFSGRALLHSVCQSDPGRFVRMAGRFSKPVLPGEELTVTAWIESEGEAVFRTASSAGVVIDAGRFQFR